MQKSASLDFALEEVGTSLIFEPSIDHVPASGRAAAANEQQHPVPQDEQAAVEEDA
jgi:hypothetical protein